MKSLVLALVTQPCLILCHPMDCGLPSSSVHGILQARMLEWVAISFSRGFSQPRDRTWVSCTAGRCFTIWATREALWSHNYSNIKTRVKTIIKKENWRPMSLMNTEAKISNKVWNKSDTESSAWHSVMT